MDGQFDRVLTAGDGYALLYKRKTSITSVENLYGVVNSQGEWVTRMRNHANEDGYNDYVYYLGRGCFALPTYVWNNEISSFYLYNGVTGISRHIRNCKPLTTNHYED